MKKVEVLRIDIVFSGDDLLGHLKYQSTKFDLSPFLTILALRKIRQTGVPQAILLNISNADFGLPVAMDIALEIEACEKAGIKCMSYMPKLTLPALVVSAACSLRYSSPLAGPLYPTARFRLWNFSNVAKRIGVDIDSTKHEKWKIASYYFSGYPPKSVIKNRRSALTISYNKAIQYLTNKLGPAIKKVLLTGVATGAELAQMSLVHGVHYPESLYVEILSILQVEKIKFEAITPGPNIYPFTSIRWLFSKTLLTPLHLRFLEITGSISEDINLIDQLKQAAKDKRCRGLLIIINSNGGDIEVADRSWALLKMLSQTMPVYAYIHSAVSAGYYIACGAQKIFANPSAIIGGIGTISWTPTYESLLKKIGVEVQEVDLGTEVLHSAKHRRNDQIRLSSRRVEIAGELFRQRVISSRGLKHQIGISGEVWDTNRAQDFQLIDQISNLSDTILELEIAGKVKNNTNFILSHAQRRPLSTLLSQKIVNVLSKR